MSSKKKKSAMKAEWSELFDIETLEDGPQTQNITADEQARKDLARRLDLLTLDELKANLTITGKKGDHIIHVKGTLNAQLQQSCVVSEAPVINEIQESVEGWFADSDAAISIAKARREKKMKAGGAEIPILDEKDDPESIIDGHIDLGELVVQHLSLAIDPYPHAEGIQYEHGDDTPGKTPDANIPNPFAKLKDWKDKLT